MWEVILMIAMFGLAIVGLFRAKRRGSLPRQGSARLEDVAHIRGGAMTTPKAVAVMATVIKRGTRVTYVLGINGASLPITLPPQFLAIKKQRRVVATISVRWEVRLRSPRERLARGVRSYWSADFPPATGLPGA
jgi:hypothetical protein